MKKTLLFLFFLIGIAGILFAWEPNDLTRFPSCTKAGDKIISLGVGFDRHAEIGEHWTYIPLLRFSLDYNAALGDKKLPFFFGGVVGYTGHGYKNNDINADFYYSQLNAGVRAGYHFNWGVDGLDTYVVSTAGCRIYFGDGYGDENGDLKVGDILALGVNVGARWFFTDFFGVWAEAGFNSISVAEIGVVFKF